MMKIKVGNPQGTQALSCFPRQEVSPEEATAPRKHSKARPDSVYLRRIEEMSLLGRKEISLPPPPLPWISPGEKRLERKGCLARPL